MPVYDQPMRKLLGSLSQTITWLDEKGSVDVSSVPEGHVDAIKQLERIGIVHKRNNRQYELQRIRLKKLMGNLGMEMTELASAPEQPCVVPAAPIPPSLN